MWTLGKHNTLVFNWLIPKWVFKKYLVSRVCALSINLLLFRTHHLHVSPACGKKSLSEQELVIECYRQHASIAPYGQNVQFHCIYWCYLYSLIKLKILAAIYKLPSINWRHHNNLISHIRQVFILMWTAKPDIEPPRLLFHFTLYKVKIDFSHLTGLQRQMWGHKKKVIYL